MGFLSKAFRRSIDDKKDVKMQEAVFDVAYPSGFLSIDFLNGSIVKVNNNSKYYSVGVIDGASITFIGRAGCGKTTLATQIGAEIIRPFPNACMFYDDIEGGSNGSRRAVLTKFSNDEINDRIIYRNSGITAENFFERISEIHDLKINNREEYEYDTGLFDPLGNRIFKFEPTVYILDSLAMLSPDKLSEEEKLSGQMSATAMARTNTSVFKRIVPKLKAANIILLVINHINDKVEINAFSRTKGQVSWLKPDETLPGGKAAIYLANNIFRLDDNTKLKESEGMGVYGTVVDLSIVKSRTNASGRSVPLVLDYFNGFDPDLSLLLFLKSNNEVNAKGAYMSMIDYPELKFTQKGFKDKLKEPEFYKAFTASCAKKLKELIREADDNTEADDSAPTISSSSILAQLQTV